MHIFDDRKHQDSLRGSAPRLHLTLFGFFGTLFLLIMAWFYRVHVVEILTIALHIAIGVLCVLALVLGMLIGFRVYRALHTRQARQVPPAQVRDAPFHLLSTATRAPGSSPPYPADHFFSYDPLNKRPSEHLRPDQRNRF